MSNEKQQDAGTDARAGGEAGAPDGQAGAPPSITAPANSIRPLRHGVDSLYLSYPGQLDRFVAILLQELKEAAQSFDEKVQGGAGWSNGEHDLAVSGRGRGRFSYVLEDGWFRIELANATAKVLPLAHVQVRSEYLTAVGMEEAISTLDRLLPEFGEVEGPASLSRIDLFVDFVTDLNLIALPGGHWVKRSKKRDIHEERDYVTGITFGAGNEVSARLYDKTVEIRKSGKDYLKPLWRAQGWEEGQTVWRMEFQVRREGLPESLKIPASETVPLLGLLWRYLTSEWLRLAIPSDSDETRSRWPTHPIWDALSVVWDVPPDAAPLVRAPKTRKPSDEAIFKSGLWGLSSFMAREGIHRVDEGLGEFLQALSVYYDSPESHEQRRLADYMERKARAKARRYNVRMKDDDRE
ncbi:hypothetical protein [Arenimonas sp.]|uniref:hypothetical protein n=1 Tax=Arenimonas sp. TaxID=1872635 RepID=UPI0039E5C802